MHYETEYALVRVVREPPLEVIHFECVFDWGMVIQVSSALRRRAAEVVDAIAILGEQRILPHYEYARAEPFAGGAQIAHTDQVSQHDH